MGTAAGSLAWPSVSDGEILSIYGAGLGPAQGVAGAYHNGFLDTQTGGTRVLFNGVPAPVLYASSGQVNTIVPFEISDNFVCVSVEYNGGPSDFYCEERSAVTPGVLVIQNPDGTINSSTAPAPRGSVITAWAYGFGPFSPPLTDGQIVAGPGGLSNPVTATIDGTDAPVQYTGPAPGLVAGVVQLNVKIPGTPGTTVEKTTLFFNVSNKSGAAYLWMK